MELLWLTIDNKLNFEIHINNICKVACVKIKGLESKFYITSLSCLSSTIVALSGFSVVKHYKTE